MRKPRTNIFLPTTSILVVGLIGLAWLAKGSDVASPVGSDSGEERAAPAVAVAMAPAFSSEDGADTAALAGIPLSVASRPAVPPQMLSDDAGMLVAQMCALHLLADGTDLALDSNQWSAFATVVLRFQAIRHTYEASIATLRIVARGQYRVEVPVYAGVGEELREQFSAELCGAIGEAKAREIMVKLGDRLEGTFAGFGLSEQTIDITTMSAGDPGGLLVTRTARYWNTAENIAATRGETHLPALEDPTGDNWGALLALVNTAGTMDGPG